MNIKTFYQSLPRKRISAGALFFNEKKELLIVKPSYKDHWSVPGGVVDENESPKEACIREVKEEINLDIKNPRFIGVDYKPARGQRNESLQFVFYGGILTQNQIDKIKLRSGEISEYKFVKAEEAIPLLSKGFQKRMPKCLEAIKNNTGIYSEEGE